MNKANISYAIRVMRRVQARDRAFDMRSWQSRFSQFNRYPHTEKAAVECGTACCFGGWLALSPGWRKQGGSTNIGGMPIIWLKPYLNVRGSRALAHFLGIGYEQARELTAEAVGEWSGFYNKPVLKITPQDVIDKLQSLMRTDK